MGQWHGAQGKGAARHMRAAKRHDAEMRNATTVPERRKSFRRGPVNEDHTRSARMVNRYREAFIAEHGVTPEQVAHQ